MFFGCVQKQTNPTFTTGPSLEERVARSAAKAEEERKPVAASSWTAMMGSIWRSSDQVASKTWWVLMRSRPDRHTIVANHLDHLTAISN